MIGTTPARSFAEKVGLLSEVALFAGLSEADMRAIGHATTMTHCVRGQRILSPDDPPDRIHIVKKGRVRVYRMTADGKQLTLDIHERGTILGDMDLLASRACPRSTPRPSTTRSSARSARTSCAVSSSATRSSA